MSGHHAGTPQAKERPATRKGSDPYLKTALVDAGISETDRNALFDFGVATLQVRDRAFNRVRLGSKATTRLLLPAFNDRGCYGWRE